MRRSFVYFFFMRTYGQSGPLRPVIFLHSILSNASLIEQPPVVYSRTNLLCRRTIVLLVFHKVGHLQQLHFFLQ